MHSQLNEFVKLFCHNMCFAAQKKTISSLLDLLESDVGNFASSKAFEIRK
jgi:Glu-tRNA(Gln) amidotransferase subunit E-like FAD-binding protein